MGKETTENAARTSPQKPKSAFDVLVGNARKRKRPPTVTCPICGASMHEWVLDMHLEFKCGGAAAAVASPTSPCTTEEDSGSPMPAFPASGSTQQASPAPTPKRPKSLTQPSTISVQLAPVAILPPEKNAFHRLMTSMSDQGSIGATGRYREEFWLLLHADDQTLSWDWRPRGGPAAVEAGGGGSSIGSGSTENLSAFCAPPKGAQKVWSCKVAVKDPTGRGDSGECEFWTNIEPHFKPQPSVTSSNGPPGSAAGASGRRGPNMYGRGGRGAASAGAAATAAAPEGSVCAAVGASMSRLTVPVLKSMLQKNVRRGRAEPAVRCALELILKSYKDFIRRILIIMLEDASLHPATPLFAWLLAAASKGFCPPPVVVGACLSAVHEIAKCPFKDDFRDSCDCAKHGSAVSPPQGVNVDNSSSVGGPSKESSSRGEGSTGSEVQAGTVPLPVSESKSTAASGLASSEGDSAADSSSTSLPAVRPAVCDVDIQGMSEEAKAGSSPTVAAVHAVAAPTSADQSCSGAAGAASGDGSGASGCSAAANTDESNREVDKEVILISDENEAGAGGGDGPAGDGRRDSAGTLLSCTQNLGLGTEAQNSGGSSSPLAGAGSSGSGGKKKQVHLPHPRQFAELGGTAGTVCRSLLLRSGYGGMPCDVALLNTASTTWRRRWQLLKSAPETAASSETPNRSGDGSDSSNSTPRVGAGDATLSEKGGTAQAQPEAAAAVDCKEGDFDLKASGLSSYRAPPLAYVNEELLGQIQSDPWLSGCAKALHGAGLPARTLAALMPNVHGFASKSQGNNDLLSKSYVKPQTLPPMLGPEDAIAAGVDFHVSNVVTEVLKRPGIMAAVRAELAISYSVAGKATEVPDPEDAIKTAMWLFRSSLNVRKLQVSGCQCKSFDETETETEERELLHSAWLVVAPEVEAFARDAVLPKLCQRKVAPAL